MSIDMKYFLLVFLIAVVSFGNAFYILSKNDKAQFAGTSFMDSQLYSYKTSLGQFEISSFDHFYGGPIAYAFWLMSTVLTTIVLLNMVVAVMGDTFGKLQEDSESSAIKEVVEIMAENEILINRKMLFGNNKYII